MRSKDHYDEFIASPKGQQVMDHISKAASLIMSHKVPVESFHAMMDMEFRQMFVKCFLHMMIGFDEMGAPVLNGWIHKNEKIL